MAPASLCPCRVFQKAPDPQTGALKLRSLLCERLLLCWALEQLGLCMSPLKTIPQLATAPTGLLGKSPVGIQSQMF